MENDRRTKIGIGVARYCKSPTGLLLPQPPPYLATSVKENAIIGLAHAIFLKALFRYPNLPQILLCKKKIPHHIKIPAHL
jgi:hypothetical protein